MTTRLSAIFLPCIIITILAITLVSGILVPIYSDEIAVHLAHARFFYDNFVLTGLFPQCGSSWLREAHWYEYPAIAIHSIIYPSNTPVFLRAAGIVFAFINLGLLWLLCTKLVADRVIQLSLCAFAFSICALGPLPYVLVMIRPEQLLLLCLILFVLLALFAPISVSDSRKKTILKVTGFLLITSVFYFAHPKAVFFAPCVIAAVYFFTYGAAVGVRVACIALYLLVTAQVVLSSRNITQCQDAPGIPKMLAEHLNNFATWDLRFFSLLDRMSSHLHMAIERITSRFLFQTNYQSQWLPGTVDEKLEFPALFVNRFVDSFMVPFFYLCMAAIILISARQLSLRQDIKRHILAVGIILGIAANAAVYSIDGWSFYTPGLVVPAFLLAVLLVAPEILSLLKNYIRYLNVLVATVYLVAILSMLTLIYSVTPKLYASAQSGEAIYSDQLISTPVFMGEKTYSTLHSLIKQCEIPLSGAQKVAVDGVAYGFLQNMQHPIDVLYVVPMGYGMDIKDLGAFLSAKNSHGILSRCDYLPPYLRERATEINGMCCLSGPALVR